MLAAVVDEHLMASLTHLKLRCVVTRYYPLLDELVPAQGFFLLTAPCVCKQARFK